MSADRPQFGRQGREISQNSGDEVQVTDRTQPITYLQELRQLPATVAKAFATPPPTDARACAAYIARDIPTIALTGAVLIGAAEVFGRVDRAFNVSNIVVNLEWVALATAVYPITILASRVTRGVSQRIDHFILTCQPGRLPR